MLKGISLLPILVSVFLTAGAQDFKDTLEVDMLVQIPVTSVKNQSKSGTCWSFATLSFIESELLRQTENQFNFSEMYVVRNAYVAKAKKYFRMHGTINFAGGGEANDVFDVIESTGIVTENEYNGLVGGKVSHNHNQMDEDLKNYMDSVIVDYNQYSEDWLPGFNLILDKYMGKLPDESKLEINSLENLGLNSSDYVYLTSFTHHPFYEEFILEVPDNWSWHSYFNIPIEELRQVVDTALFNGYSVVWAADYSEDGFLFNDGLAVVPEIFYRQKTRAKFADKSGIDERIVEKVTNLKKPADELVITQELRQKGFDNYETTDDHLMQIVGKAQGADGKTYFYVKNSWGRKGVYDGYFFVTEAYFDYKSISIMLHKSALPQSLKEFIK